MKITLITFLVFILSVQISNAQWQKCNGIGSVNSFAGSGNYIFASSDTGVYISSDEGANWKQTTLTGQSVLSLFINDNAILAGTVKNGIYFSEDNGTSWAQTSINNLSVQCFTKCGSNIFAGCWDTGLYISGDGGKNWKETSLKEDIWSITSWNNLIFAGGEGIFISSDNGASWTKGNGMNEPLVMAIAKCGDNLVAGNWSYKYERPTGVWVSTNSGTDWKYIIERNVNTFAVVDNNIFMGSSYGLEISTDNGVNWIDKNQGLASGRVKALSITNKYIYAAIQHQGYHEKTVYSVWRRNIADILK
jgi:hypothetical protein